MTIETPETVEIKGTLLVVEDDSHLLLGIREILELDNYSVMIANDGREALDMLQDETTPTPDLIISDIMMPRMNGFEFLRAVRDEPAWVRIPFIFLTAKGEKPDIKLGKQLGVDDYLVKPYEPEELIIAVDSRRSRWEALKNDAKVQATEAIEDVKRGLITMLNHEMRTPLTLIVAYADMLREFDSGTMSDEEVMTFLKGVNSGADRIRRLIENFILIVEVDSGDAANTFEWRSYPIENFDMIVQTAHDQIIRKDENLGRKCEIMLPNPIPTVFGDRDYLTVIIRELLDNAFKFSPPASIVDLNIRKAGIHLCIEVVDYGRGVPEEEQDKIWGHFYQIARDKTEDQGAGSGLALVKHLTEIHGGYVELESADGDGSTFRAYIPLQKAF